MTLKLGILYGVLLLALLGTIALTGVSPGFAFQTLIESTLGKPQALTRTIAEMTPLVVAGLAVYVALKAGLFNIGVEGQMTVGALLAVLVALNVGGPAGILLAFVAGAIGGGLWALPAAWIKAYRGGHEVISTIMLNNVAAGLSLMLLAGPLKAPGQENTTTARLQDSVHIPNLIDSGRFDVSLGTFLAIFAIGVFHWWIAKTVPGFELRLVGANPTAAKFAGVSPESTHFKAMVASGAVGGLAGTLILLAYEKRYYPGIASGIGFDALGVALLAGRYPLLLIPVGFVFGILVYGSNTLQTEGIPKGITFIITALLIIGFAAWRFRRGYAAA